MPVAKPTRAELLQSGIAFLRARTPLTNFAEGSVGGGLAALHAQHMSDFYDRMDAAERARDIELATGTDLDNLARSFGVSRLSATQAGSASGTGQLLVSSSAGVGLAFPAGTAVWSPADPATRFYTAATVTAPAGGSTTAILQGARAGQAYNAAAGSLTAHNADSRFTVTNFLPVLGGSAGETDDALRYRLSQLLMAAVLGGPSSTEGVRNALLALPGVGDVILTPLSRGPGTLDALIVPQDGYQPDDDFLTSVTEELARVAAAGVSVRALAPEVLSVTAEVLLSVGQTAQTAGALRTLMTQVVQGYVNARRVQAAGVPAADSSVVYSTLLALLTDAALSVLGSALLNVSLLLSVGADDPSLQGTLTARAGQVFQTQAVRVTVTSSAA